MLELIQILIRDVAIVFGISLMVNCLIVATKKYHIDRSARTVDRVAVQSAHKVPTPRIGGVGIILGLLVALLVLMPDNHGSAWWLFAVSLVPIFAAGLAEDIGFGVSPLGRLLAAAASSAVCVAVLGLWIPRADVPGLDLLFLWAPFAIVFTVFAASGICHAFNLIDGVNGLAAGTSVVVAVGLAIIAVNAGELAVATAALMLVAAVAGFFVLNYPLGKIFLGDAGAYTVGHVLAWLSIVLLARVETLSAWAILLVLFWPLADTVLAIYRRRRSGKPAGQPDRLHFHQLVMRSFEIAHFGKHRRHIANPLTTLVILPMAAAPMVAGVLLWNQPLAAFVAFVAFSVAFFLCYVVGVRFASGLARKMNRPAQLARSMAGARPAELLARGRADVPIAKPVWSVPVAARRMGADDLRVSVDSH